MKKVYQYDNVIPSGKIVHFYRKNHFNLFMLREVLEILIPAAMTNYHVFYKYRNRCTKLEMTTNAAWTVMPCLNPNMKSSK